MASPEESRTGHKPEGRFSVLEISPSASNFLNFSRWFGAFLVLVHHVRHIVFADYRDLESPTVLSKGFYVLTGLGHEALVTFFVLSGFLIGGSSIEKLKLGTFDISQYFCRRIARIYTVFIPALAVGAILDKVGILNLDDARLYTDSLIYNINSLDWTIADNLNLRIFLGNLAMLQMSCFPVFGSNGPLWSLAYEWWYYVILGLAMMFACSRTRAAAYAWLVFGSVLVFVLSPLIFFWIIIWALGIICFFYAMSDLPKPHPTIGVAVFLGVLFASRLSHSSEIAEPDSVLKSFARDLMLGCGYSVLLISVLVHGGKPLFPKLNSALANFSYSLYICHFPALVFLVSLFYSLGIGKFQRQPSTGAFGFFVCLSIMLILWGFAFYLLAEVHTGRVSRTLEESVAMARRWRSSWQLRAQTIPGHNRTLD